MSSSRSSERGNVFFTLFGAVAVVGVLGAGIMATMRGPLSTMVEVNRREQAKAELRVAVNLVLVNSDDDSVEVTCEGGGVGDGFTEGLAPDPGGSLSGGGLLPAIGATQNDPWGNPYGYCVWDHGPFAADYDGACSGYLAGSDSTGNIAIAVVSAGPDGVFQTSCVADNGGVNDYIEPDGGGGDDLLEAMTYSQAVSGSGGLWSLTDPTTAAIDKDLNVTGGASFTGDVDLSATASSQLRLGAASMVFPDDNVLGTCSPGNNLLLRVNDGPANDEVPRLEICDGPTSTWLSAGTPWNYNGDEIFYNTDNVGIGVADPSYTLDVDGTFGATEAVTLGDALGVSGATTLSSTLDVTSTTTLSATLDVLGDTTITGDANSGTTDALSVMDSDSSVVFVVQNDGAVGINVDDPSQELDVSGDVTISGDYMVGGTVILGNGTVSSNILLGEVGAPVAATDYMNLGDVIHADLTTANKRVGIGFADNYDAGLFDDTLEVNGDTDIDGDLDLSGRADVGGDLDVTGSVTVGTGLIMGNNNTGRVLVADGTDFNSVVMSGDVNIDSTGDTTIQNDVIDEDKLAMDNVPGSGECLKFISGVLRWDGCSASGGGDGVGASSTLAQLLDNTPDGNDGGGYAIINIADPTNAQDVATKNYVDTEISNGGDQIIDADLDTKVQVEESADEDIIRFDTAGTERMIIDAAGNIAMNTDTFYLDAVNGRIGIGQAVPTSALHIEGTGADQRIQVRVTPNSNAAILNLDSGGIDAALRMQSGVFSIDVESSPEALNIASNNGFVGLGTTTPAATLEVAGTDSILFPRGDGTNRPASPVNGMMRYNTATDRYEAYQAGAWQDIITSGGGGVTALADNDGDTLVQVEEGPDDDTIRFDTAGAERMVILPDGSVGIGSSSDLYNSALFMDKSHALDANSYSLYVQSTNTPTVGMLTGNRITSGIRTYLNGTFNEDVGNDYTGSLRAGDFVSFHDANNTGSNLTGFIHGIRGLASQEGSGNVANVIGGQFIGRVNDNAGTVNLARGAIGQMTAYDGSVVSVGRGLEGNIYSIDAGTTVTDARAVHGLVKSADTGSGAGVITTGYALYGQCEDAATCYGLYINAGDAEVPAGEDWGIYVTGEDQNSLSGGLAIGSTFLSSGVQDLELDVTGDIGADNYCDADGNNCFTAASVGSSASQLADTDNDTLVQVEESADEDIIRFDTAGTERMVISAAGNVGIGTNDPQGNLDVASNGSALLDLASDINVTSSNRDSMIRFWTDGPSVTGTRVGTVGYDESADVIKITSGTMTQSHLVIDASGNVGVGTATPAATLEVAGTDSILFPRGDGTNRPGSPVNGMMRYNTASGKFEAYQAGAWQDIITSGAGGVTTVSDADNDTLIEVEQTADEDIIHFTVNGEEVMWVDETGGLRILGQTDGSDSGMLLGAQNGTVGWSLRGDTFDTLTKNIRWRASGPDAAGLKWIWSEVDGTDSAIMIDAGGRYIAGADSLTFRTGSTIGTTASRMHIDASGRVGIGEDAPSANLHIKTPSVTVPTFRMERNGIGYFQISGNGGSPATVDFSVTNDFPTTAKAISIVSNSSGGYTLGDVGIGTDAPSTKLQVDGSIRFGNGGETCTGGNFAGAVRYSGGNLELCDGTSWEILTTAGGVSVSSVVDADNDTKIQVEESADEDIIRFDTAGSQRMVIDASGSVGIGKSIPTAAIDAYRNGRDAFVFTANANNTDSFVMQVNDFGTTGYDNRYIFRASLDGTDQFNISTSGQGYFSNALGIGLTSPSHSLSMGSTTTGLAHYNTVDTTTNYERARMNWNSNVFQIYTNVAGTGTKRSIRIGASDIAYPNSPGSYFEVQHAGNMFNFGSGIENAANYIVTSGLTSSLSSGPASFLSVNPTIDQSGTASYSAFVVDPTENTVGSGNNYLARFAVSGTDQVVITNDGDVGIGTSTPAGMFHVYDGSASTGVTVEGGVGSLSGMGIITAGDGASPVDASGTKGWSMAAWGDNFGDVAFQNDLAFLAWDGATNTPALLMDYGTGYVGINETDPDTMLHVGGSITFGDGGETCTGGNFAGAVRYNSGSLELCDGTAWTALAAGASGSAGSLVDADGDTMIQVEESADEDIIRFDTAGTERMVISSDGNVGIGADPKENLQLGLGHAFRNGGSGLIAHYFNSYWDTVDSRNEFLGFGGGGTYGSVFSFNSNSGTFNLNISDAVGNADDPVTYTNVMSLINDGSVGFGTSTPSVIASSGTGRVMAFQAHSANGETGEFAIAGRRDTGSGDLGYLTFSDQSNGQAQIVGGQDGTDGEGYMRFLTATSDVLTERMRIDSNGNVGIGKTSPDQALDVVGNIYVRETGSPSIDRLFLMGSDTFASSNGNSKTYAHIGNLSTTENLAFTMLGDDVTDRITFMSDYGDTGTYTEHLSILAQNGYVGIGTPSPEVPLDVVGNVYIRHSSNPTDDKLFLSAAQSIASSNGDTKTFAHIGNMLLTESLAFSMIGNDSTDRISFMTDYGDTGTYTERMVVVSQTGNVGVGVTAPDTLLEVGGSITFGNGGETCTGGSFAGAVRYNSGALELCNGSAWSALGSGGSGTAGSLVDADGDTSVLVEETADEDIIHFYNAGSETMRIDENGNVSISSGYGSPIAKSNVTYNAGHVFSLTGNKANGSDIYFDADGLISAEGSVFLNLDSDNSSVNASFNISNNSPLHTGSSVFTVTEAAQVGIGTDSPETPLHVVQDSVSNDITATIDGYGDSVILQMRAARGTVAAPTAVQNGDVIGNIGIVGYGATQFSSVNNAAIKAIAAENFTDAANGAHMNFSTTPVGSVSIAERMRITSEGDVGIGTSSPGGKFHVLADTWPPAIMEIERADGNVSRSAVALYRTNSAGAGADGIGVHMDMLVETETEGTVESVGQIMAVATDATAGTVDGDIYLKPFLDGAGVDDAFVVKSSGNIGVGTSSPIYDLHFDKPGEDEVGLFIQDPTTDETFGIHHYYDNVDETAKLEVLNSGSVTSFMRMERASGDISIGNTAGTSVFVDGANGYVGIAGITAPDAALHVTNTADITGVNNAGEGAFVLGTGTSTGFTLRIDPNELQSSVNGVANGFTLNTFGGNVAVGSVSNTGQNFVVSSDGHVTSFKPGRRDTTINANYTTMSFSGATDRLYIAGGLEVAGSVIVGDGSETCSGGNFAGAVRYNSGVLQLCDGTAWATLASGASGSAGSLSDADGDTLIQVEEAADEDYIRFDTAGTQRMTITDTGNITFSPNGGSAGSTFVRSWNSSDTDIDGLLPGSDFGNLVDGASNAHFVIGIRDNDVNDSFSILSRGNDYATDTSFDTVVFTAKGGGNIGISTAAPDSKLHIVGTGTIGNWAGFDLTNATLHVDDGIDSFYTDGNSIIGTSQMLFGTANADEISFGTWGAERMSIESNGDTWINSTDTFFVDASTDNVGIGTASPGDKLTVVGDLSIRNVDDNVDVMHFNNANSVGSDYDIRFLASGVIAADDDLFVNIDSDNDTTDGAFVIKKDAYNTTGTTIFTVEERGAVGIGSSVVNSNAALDVRGGEIFLDEDDDTNGGWIAEAGLDGIGLVGHSSRLDDPDLYVTGSGDVGIGTTEPDAELHVIGTGSLGGWASFNTSNASFHIYDGATNMYMDGNTILSDSSFLIGTEAANSLALGTNSTERLRIAGDGDIGIGTNTPAGLLHVYNNGEAEIILEGSNTSTPGIVLLTEGDGGTGLGTAGVNGWAIGAYGNAHANTDYQNDLLFSYWNGASASVPMYFDSATGNVGVGTLNPSADFDVNGIAEVSQLSWENGVNRITSNDGAGNVQIRFGHDHSSSDERFTHDNGGAVYIGANIDSATTTTLTMKASSNTGAGDDVAVTWGSELNLDDTDLAWDGDFTVYGAAYKTGGGSWTATSDIRLKDLDGGYDKGLAEIVSLEPIMFHYKKDNARGLNSSQQEYGFVAQDVQQIFPEAVEEGRDGFLGLNMHTINVAVVNAIKEIKGLIDDLADKIKQLFDIVNRLEAENKQLREEVDGLKAQNQDILDRLGALEAAGAQ